MDGVLWRELWSCMSGTKSAAPWFGTVCRLWKGENWNFYKVFLCKGEARLRRIQGFGFFPPLYFSFPFTFSVMEVNRCQWENVSWRKATRLVRFFQEMVTGLECCDCHFFSLEMGTESTAFPAKLTLFLLKGLDRIRSFVGHLAAVVGCTCHQSLVEMAGS